MWQGVGDGTFVDVTRDWLGEQSPGRGLGIIVGELDDDSGADVYIANDMTANHFWSSRKPNKGDVGSPAYHMSEQAAIRGLAFNAKSLSQASMGIAADDYNGDGKLDFYVTNFTDDYNTLYTQVGSGVWSDRTAAANLVEPTYAMLGYGTQWIDADNDGQLELTVANGNVDDFSHSGKEYRMPMTFFHQLENGSFAQVNAITLGPYFATKRLGRALVTVDANLDSQVDLLVTHLFDPAALLINNSESIVDGSRNALTLHLVGTQSHRDGIGARVTVQAGEGPPITRQLLGGNGYQCSNERYLRFGLGAARIADSVTIQWSSGHQQVLKNISTNETITVVEDSLPRPKSLEF